VTTYTYSFLGLILVPLVEKAAEHLTAIDESWDNQTNFALSHILGACVQTALLNTPVIVFVGWGLGINMNLNFEIFDAAVLILAIVVVGNFLRDGKSNWLEGALCFITYVIIALAAFYYPNPPEGEPTSSGTSSGGEGGSGGEAAASGSEGGTATAAAEAGTHAATEAAKLLLRSAGYDI